jgi:hypothetical protein
MGFFARAAALLGLNMIDAANTQLAIGRGLARELNPAMAWAISHGFVCFWLMKFAVVFIGIALLYRARFYKAAGVALSIAVAVYSALAIYQIGFWVSFLVR